MKKFRIPSEWLLSGYFIVKLVQSQNPQYGRTAANAVVNVHPAGFY